MQTKEILLKIKALFSEPEPQPATEPQPEPAPIEFKEYSLADGSKVKVDKLEAGGKVIIVAADGSESDAPAGEYVIATGETISVGDGGMIAAVAAAEPQPEPQPAPVADEKMDSAFASIEALKSENKLIKESFKQLVELVESLTNDSAVQHTEPAPKQQPRDEREERIFKAKEAFNNLKK